MTCRQTTSLSTDSSQNAEILDDLLSRFRRNGKSISVSFRDLVSPATSGPRAAHQIHRYPAKLLAHIPFFLLNNDLLSAPSSVVLDPFCGSGTVLLESLLAERCALGADSNPLARLIAEVKTTPLEQAGVRASARRMLARVPNQPSTFRPEFKNLDYWFHPHTIRQLAQLRTAISRVQSTEYRQFFLVCLSECARRVSRADPRILVPVRLREDQYPKGHWLREKTERLIRQLRSINVHRAFEHVLWRNIDRMRELTHAPGLGCYARVVSDDARSLEHVRSDSIDIVVTSPPYMGAQKYIRSSALGLAWLPLDGAGDLPALERACLGREHFRKAEYATLPKTGIPGADQALCELYRVNALRACLAANYLIEMRKALRETVRTLRPAGHFVLVCSNNTVGGRLFQTQNYLRSILTELGLVERLRLIDTIRSRGLMTKRNKTASMISREWVLIYQKPGIRSL